jgi:Secretion system C-terminal sorting domain
MKSIFTLLILLVSIVLIHAQSAITINESDMPIPTAEIPIVIVDHTKIKNPTGGTNVSWDYSEAIPTETGSSIFYPETAQFFKDAGIDVYIDVFKKFNENFGYYISQEWDINSTGIYDKAHYVYPQAYGLGTFTGNSKDSLIMDEQGYILSDPRVVIKFPMTMGTAWKSTSRRYSDFRLKVSAFNLVNTPARHVFYTIRQDSIVAWGKMRVPTENGISNYHDVLMERVKSSIVDSFYLAGQPAPPALLVGFSITQGQKLDESHLYNIYRKGQLNYFMRVNYGTDKSYTKPVSAFINIDGLETSASKDEIQNFSSIVYPSPANESVNIMLGDINQTFDTYEIIDAMGRTINNGDVNQSGNTVTIDIHTIPNGNYYVKLHNLKSKIYQTESISILK